MESPVPPEDSQDTETKQPATTFLGRIASLGAGARGLPRWAASNRLKAGILGGVCLLSVSAGVVAWMMLASCQATTDRKEMLAEAMESLDSGAYAEARDVATELAEKGGLGPDASGGPAFVLGVVAYHEATDVWDKDKKAYYLLAARHLEEARDRGFPEGRKAEGLFLLGRSLYRSGQIPASRPVLREAIEANLLPAKKTEARHLLAAACLDDKVARLDEALEHNTQYLSDRLLGPDARGEGLVQRGRILFRLGKIQECLEALDQIPPRAKNRSEAMVLRGRVLMHEARWLKDDIHAGDPHAGTPHNDTEQRLRIRGKYQAAIKVLRQAQGLDTLGNQASRKAMYLIGVCLAESGKPAAAVAQFKRTRLLHPDSPEALAAEFQEAELLRRRGSDKRALAAYRRLLRAVGQPDQFVNPWITVKQLRIHLLEAYRHYVETQNFESAISLAGLLHPLFPRSRQMQLAADAYRGWGRFLLDQAAHLPHEQANPLLREGRRHFRRAGRIHATLAQLRIATRHYPDDLWNAAENYMQGQGYREVIRVLRRYVDNESRRRHPRALVMLGEAMLCLGKVDEALGALQDCVEYHPHDAAAYRARWLASQAYRQKNDLKQAVQLLREIRNGEDITPKSEVWQDALVDLGNLLYADGQYAEAIPCLEEAVQRRGDSPRAMVIRYLIADAYRQRARVAGDELRKELAESAYFTPSKQARHWFHTALDRYADVRGRLNQQRDTRDLSEIEKDILRNSYFAGADVLFELAKYQQAIKTYTTIVNRYQNEPEVLQAYLQIARTYRRLGQPQQARGAVEQAKIVLNRMKTDVPFEKVTVRSRKQWEELLDSLTRS
jgi:tetratricopeptide (TPR) repeat protein